MNKPVAQHSDDPCKGQHEVNTEAGIISNELQTILDDLELPEEKKERIKNLLVSVTVQKASRFSGPLPPPEILGEYSSVISNGAERIMKMTENQSIHRISLEKQVISSQIKQSSRGQWFGFIVGIVGLGLASLLATMGHEIISGIFGTTTIVGLAAVFVIGKRSQAKELEDKQ